MIKSQRLIKEGHEEINKGFRLKNLVRRDVNVSVILKFTLQKWLLKE
jgi:hypothetical protein